MLISLHARADFWWSKRAKYGSLLHCAFWCKHREQWHSCLAFFSGFKWMSLRKLLASFFFMWWTLGVKDCQNGRGGGIPQGEQGNSFICRLPSCLVQIFHKVLRFWHESKTHLYSRVFPPFEIVHHLSRTAVLTAGANSSIVGSPCLMLFRKPRGSTAHGEALNYDSIYCQQRLFLIDISAILHLMRSSMFTGTPSFQPRL